MFDEAYDKPRGVIAGFLGLAAPELGVRGPAQSYVSGLAAQRHCMDGSLVISSTAATADSSQHLISVVHVAAAILAAVGSSAEYRQ